MGQPVQPIFDFDGFRGRSAVPDPSGVDAAFDGSDVAANTGWDQDVDVLIRIRMLIKQTDAGMVNNTNTETEFILQYENFTQDAGNWIDVGAVGGGTEDVDFVSATGFVDRVASEQLLGSGNNVIGDGLETDGEGSTIVFDEEQLSEAEFEVSLIVNGDQVADDDVINFRWLYSDDDETTPTTVLHVSPGTNNATFTVNEPPVDVSSSSSSPSSVSSSSSSSSQQSFVFDMRRMRMRPLKTL